MIFPVHLHKHKAIIDEDMIARRIHEIVDVIAQDFDDKDFVVIGILKGSFIFLADLVRQFYHHRLQPQVDFMILSSYGAGTAPTTMVKVERDVFVDITGKNVLVVDDILDTGRTMQYIKERLKWLEPAMVKTCVLLDKPSRRKVDIQADYVGFLVEDLFVIGYGLDYDGYFRELPYIAVMEKEESNNEKSQS